MRFVTRFLIIVMLLGLTMRINAVEPAIIEASADSVVDLRPLSSWQKFNRGVDKVTSQKWFQMTSVGVPLIVTGLAVIPGKERFAQLRNDYAPKFSYEYDDYLQYAPAAVMLGLKSFGYKGRSKWGRMLVSDAFSVALMASLVNSIKYTARVQRPDKSNYKSFPSGHTATAFMTATMLHKEYGDRSPWFSVGAYTVAAVAGVSRQLNNRHWLSDVLAGAGIGILSTELGYFFADLIFKKKGLNFESPRYFPLLEKPSFVGMRMGFVSRLGDLHLANGLRVRPGVGSQAGVEGAYFFNKYIGCGGIAAVSNMPMSLVEKPEVSLKAMDEGRVMAGGYFNYPCTSRWSVGGKVIAGYSYIPNRSVDREEIKFDKDNFVWSTGVSLGYILKRNFGARVFCDYTSTAVSYRLTPSAELGIVEAQSKKGVVHALIWGASANILF